MSGSRSDQNPEAVYDFILLKVVPLSGTDTHRHREYGLPDLLLSVLLGKSVVVCVKHHDTPSNKTRIEKPYVRGSVSLHLRDLTNDENFQTLTGVPIRKQN